MSPQQSWQSDHPALHDWLSQQDADACRRWHDQPEALCEALIPLLPSLAALQTLTNLPLRGDGAAALAAPLLTDTPQRKSQQAHHLVSALHPLDRPMLDWCCGKGHLARALAAQSQLPVHGVELDAALVADGNRLAQRFNVPVQIRQQDVLLADVTVTPGSHVVALHACGGLHRRLLAMAQQADMARISLSPCCYHAHLDHPEQAAMSQQVRQHPQRLLLTAEHLRLMVRETVTAPTRVRRQRERVNAWRLGFDGLQRSVRQTDSYLPLPSHPAALANSDFTSFCKWAAQQKALLLPPDVDFAYWELYGKQRWQTVTQQELLRHLFSRALELWQVLDYALYLQEQGFEVTLSRFCPRTLTPRNVLIDARRLRETVATRAIAP